MSEGRTTRFLVILIFFYLVFRLLVLSSHVYIQVYELYRGTLAIEMIEGLRLPWGDYLTDSYSLAPLFSAFLTVPFFLFFGPSLFVLKLVPFFWHLFSLIVWFFVWRFFFGETKAFLISLLFIFAPPPIVAFSLVNHGSHFEMILWLGLSLLLFKRIFDGKISWGLGGLLLGLLTGFAANFTLLNGVTALVLFLYVFLAGGRKIFYGTFTLGFFIGLSPLLFYNGTHSLAGENLLKQLFFYPLSPALFLDHFKNVFIKGEGGLKGVFGLHELGHPYLVIYAVCFFSLWIRKWPLFRNLRGRFDIEIFALLYQITLLSLAVFARFGWASYYLFPLVPFIGMTLVVGFADKTFFLRWAPFGLCLLLGFVGCFKLIDFKGMGKTLQMQGWSYGDLGSVMEHNFGKDLTQLEEKAGRLLLGRNLFIRKAFYQDIPDEVFAMKQKEDIFRKLKFIDSVEGELKPILFEKLGIQLGGFVKFDLQKVQEVLRKASIPSEFYPDIVRGIAIGWNRVDLETALKLQRGLAFCLKFSGPLRGACYEGTGRYFAADWVEGDPQVRKALRSFNKKDAVQGFLNGVAQEISKEEDLWRRDELTKKSSSY